MNLPSEMQIGNPDAKLWFAAVLLVLFSMMFAVWIRRRSIGRFATRDRIKPIFGSGTGKQFRTFARGVGLTLAIVLLTLGLMDFRWGKIQREVPQEGIELMFLLDVSRSMLAEDVTPNRLERAKQMIRDMITAMAGDRVGLVVFAGETRRMIPLTNHYEAFITTLAEIDPDSVRRGGSKLGDAIEVAGDGFLSKTNSQRVMVVLTDGEDQESQPASVAKKLRDDKGIRIFTVGLGDMESGANIPDSETERIVRYQGKPVVTKLDGEILQQVAQASGGAYVPAGTKQVDMKAVYDRYIGGMEKTDFDTAKIDAYEARFQWFAIPALVILLIEAMGISLPRRKSRLVVFAMMAMLSSSGAVADEATEMTEIYNQGVQSFRENDLDSAVDLFDQASRASNSELATTARYNAATTRISRVKASLEGANSQVADSEEGKPESAEEELQAAIDRLRLALRLRPRWQDARANLQIALRLMDQLNQKRDERSEEEKEQQNKSDSSDKDSSDKSEKSDGKQQQDQPEKPDPSNSNASEQEQSETKDDSSTSPEQNDLADQPKEEPSSDGEQDSDDPVPGESDQQPNEPQTGELEADDKNQNDQGSQTGEATELAESESMTEEEARKMLQAVRDRDMIRRFRQQQLRRSRQVPVDKDW